MLTINKREVGANATCGVGIPQIDGGNTLRGTKKNKKRPPNNRVGGRMSSGQRDRSLLGRFVSLDFGGRRRAAHAAYGEC